MTIKEIEDVLYRASIGRVIVHIVKALIDKGLLSRDELKDIAKASETFYTKI